MEDILIELEAARRNLNIMKENRGIVDLNGNIEQVQQWLNAYAYLEEHVSVALRMVREENKKNENT